ncbi:MAG: hypothetical protein J7L15_00605, partial [Clostridiales bacterium]|nr:hypothetical protein [Clostridiales bacterium]
YKVYSEDWGLIPSGSDKGLFIKTDGATIRNITFEDITYSDNQYSNVSDSGIVTGSSADTTFSNIKIIDCQIVGVNICTGNLGMFGGAAGEIAGCTFEDIFIYGCKVHSGGIDPEDSYNQNDYGILAPHATNCSFENIEIRNCFLGVETDGVTTSSVGAMVGRVINTDYTCTITNCKVDVDLIARTKDSTITSVGQFIGSISLSGTSTCTIEDCVAVGPMDVAGIGTGTITNYGGIGVVTGGTVTINNSYRDNDRGVSDDTGQDLTSKTTTQLYDYSTYNGDGWDISEGNTNLWKIVDEIDYPYLYQFDTYHDRYPNRIGTLYELWQIDNSDFTRRQDYILTNPIDMSLTDPNSSSHPETWESGNYTVGDYVIYDDSGTVNVYYCHTDTPTQDPSDIPNPTDTDYWNELWIAEYGWPGAVIGYSVGDQYFGRFDGNNKVISNMFIASRSYLNPCRGLFGKIIYYRYHRPELKNVIIRDFIYEGSSDHGNDSSFGAVVGEIYGTNDQSGDCFPEINISNCQSNGTITMYTDMSYPGSGTSFLVGYSDNQIINFQNCTVSGDCSMGASTVNHVSGLVGYLHYGSVRVNNCDSTFNFWSDETNTSTSSHISGLIGYSYYPHRSSEIDNCTYTGTLQGDSDVGGLFSSIYGGFSIANCSVEACLGSDSELSCTRQNIGGLVGSAISSPGDSIIENSNFRGDVIGTYCVGGLVGSFSCAIETTRSPIISSCSVRGRLIPHQASYLGHGGIIGLYDGVDSDNMPLNVVNCAIAVNIETDADSFASGGSCRMGGILGYEYAGSVVIDSCSVISILSHYGGTGTDMAVGGFIGYGITSIIRNSFFRGEINSDIAGYLGGIIGYVASVNNIVSKCYVAASFTLSASTSGPIYGYKYTFAEITVADTIWDSTLAYTGFDNYDGEHLSTTNMTTISNVDNYTDPAQEHVTSPWDFVDNPDYDPSNNDYWYFDEGVNEDYPILTFDNPSADIIWDFYNPSEE